MGVGGMWNDGGIMASCIMWGGGMGRGQQGVRGSMWEECVTEQRGVVPPQRWSAV